MENNFDSKIIPFYPYLGFVLFFLLTFIGITIEDIIHDVPYNESIRDWHHYFTPIIVGLGGLVLGVALRRAREKRLNIFTQQLLAEGKFKSYLENAGDAIYLHDYLGNILECNNQAINDTGYEKDALLKMKVYELDNVNADLSKYQSVLNKICIDKPIQAEVYHQRRNGEVFPVEVKVCKVESDQEKNSIYLSIARNISERKDAELALKNAGNKFQLFYDEAPLSYQSLDIEGYIIDINPTWTETIGYTREEIIGRHFSFLMSESSKKKMHKVFEQFIKDGYVTNVVFEIRKKDNSLIAVNLNGKLSYNPDGSFKQTHCILTDITERLFIEEILGFTSQLGWKDRGEKFFQVLSLYLCQILGMDYAYVGLLQSDKKTIKTIGLTNNQKAIQDIEFKLIDTPANLVVGNKFCVYEDKVQSHFPGDKSLLKINAEGYAGFPLRDSNGKPIGLIGVLKSSQISNTEQIEAALKIVSSRVAQEIEQLKNEEVLRESEGKFKLLSSLAFEGIIIHKGSEIRDVNNAAERIFGYSSSELVNSFGFLDLIESNHVALVEKYLDWDNTPPFEALIRKKDGAILGVEIESKHFKYNREKLTVSAVRDITERKNAERKVFEAIVETEEKERKRFAEDLHDELGPVLSGIKLYIDELGYDDISAEKREELNVYLKKFINDAVSKTRTISHEIMPSSLFDYGLVKALESFSSRISSVGNLKIYLNSDIPDFFENRLVEIVVYRVVNELINNTIKHAEATEVKIDLKYADNKLQIFYEDNGIGFDIEKEIKQNAGLGLNNIQNRLKSLNGRTEFSSVKDVGFKFKTIIPL